MRIKHKLGKSQLEYDTVTGHFYWTDCCRKPSFNGKRAEHKTTNGYLYIKAGGKQHSASRLAYKLYYKQHPAELEIDHINRVRDDNRPENLRLADRFLQSRNRSYKKNLCGVTGVSLHKKSGLFRARYKNKTTYHKTIAQAATSYDLMFAEYGKLPVKFKHGRD